MITRISVIFVALILLFAGCRTVHHGSQSFVCGMTVEIDPEFEFFNFPSFLDSSGRPLSTVYLDTQRIYSPDHKFYFEYQLPLERSTQVVLYNTSGKVLAKFKELSLWPMPVWLEDCVIVGNASNEKKVIHLITGKIKTHVLDRWVLFIGQTNKKAFFGNEGEKQMILSLDSKGMKNVLVKTDTLQKGYRYHYNFYNTQSSLRSLDFQVESCEARRLRIDLMIKDKVVLSMDSIGYFGAQEDSYFYKGAAYLKINGNEFYKLDENTFEKIIDLRETQANGWIRDFIIEGDYLIFKTQNTPLLDFFLADSLWVASSDSILTANKLWARQNVYGYNTIGIVNLKTKECFYPEIRYSVK